MRSKRHVSDYLFWSLLAASAVPKAPLSRYPRGRRVSLRGMYVGGGLSPVLPAPPSSPRCPLASTAHARPGHPCSGLEILMKSVVSGLPQEVVKGKVGVFSFTKRGSCAISIEDLLPPGSPLVSWSLSKMCQVLRRRESSARAEVAWAGVFFPEFC